MKIEEHEKFEEWEYLNEHSRQHGDSVCVAGSCRNISVGSGPCCLDRRGPGKVSESLETSQICEEPTN